MITIMCNEACEESPGLCAYAWHRVHYVSAACACVTVPRDRLPAASAFVRARVALHRAHLAAAAVGAIGIVARLAEGSHRPGRVRRR